MLTTIGFRPQHVAVMDLPPDEERTRDELVKIGEFRAAGGPCITMIDPEGSIVACGGYVIVCPGVAEAWFLPSSHLWKYRFSVHKIVRRFRDQAGEDLSLHRVQAVVRADAPKNCNWTEAFGFPQEDRALLRKFDALQRDYYLYARVS